MTQWSVEIIRTTDS